MKRILSTAVMTLGIIIALAVSFLGISSIFYKIVYVGFSVDIGIVVYLVFILLAGAMLFFAIRWGLAHEKRVLAIAFLVCAVVLVALSVNYWIGYANSFPAPSQAWLATMAESRAHIRGLAAMVDVDLLQQGRTSLSGSAVLTLAYALLLAWYGRSWLVQAAQA